MKKGDFNTPNISMIIKKEVDGYDPIANGYTPFDVNNQIDVKVGQIADKVYETANMSYKLVKDTNETLKFVCAKIEEKNLFWSYYNILLKNNNDLVHQ